MPETYSVAFYKISELAQKLGVQNINKLPACWEHDLPNGWRFHVNGHNDPIEDSRTVTVPPFHASIWKNDDFAGFISPSGGTLIGIEMSPREIEDAFIDALDEAISETIFAELEQEHGHYCPKCRNTFCCYRNCPEEMPERVCDGCKPLK